MYKLSVPVTNRTVNKETREKYAEKFKAAGAERVFVAPGRPSERIPRELIENVAYFKSQGFEVGVWISTLGHGGALSHETKKSPAEQFNNIVNIDGVPQGQGFCPLDARLKAFYSDYVARLAEECRPDMVMLDDDFRMSIRKGELPCCACPDHMARISEILGEKISAEAIRPYILSGKANKYRDAWFKAQNDGLLELAEAIRKEVDKRAPDVNVCVCSAPSWWNVDGTDGMAISRALAGKNPPILRLSGAPYWAVRGRRSLITVLDYSRACASFCHGNGIELMCEGDSYPRPRQNCPASFVEIFDGVMRADGGYDGILKYMFDYTAGPELELGYLKLHNCNRAMLDKIGEWFADGANAGVRAVVKPYNARIADLDLSSYDLWSPFPSDATMLGSSSIPTVYRGEGICNSVFGENARLYDLKELKKGSILDGASAVILSERGVDVGIECVGGFEKRTIGNVAVNDNEKACIFGGTARILSAKLKSGATPLLYAYEGGDKFPIAYSYENEKGERFAVFLFEGDSLKSDFVGCSSGLLTAYPTAEALVKVIPWVARQPIPAYSEKNPELYLMCRKDEESLSVALFNCFADPVTEPVITLGEGYSKIECVGCDARIDGNKVTLVDMLHGYSISAFRVYK